MKASRKKRRRFPPRSGSEAESGIRRASVTLTGFDEFGAATGRDDEGKPVAAAFGIPGEVVVVEVREESDSRALGEVVEVVQRSPERVEPRCPHFGVCGGCQLQHLNYAAQIRMKTQIVRDRLREVGGFVQAPVSPMVGAESPWNYRNHARFTVRLGGSVGFTHWYTHRFEPVDECHIMDPRINAVRAALEKKLEAPVRQLGVRYGSNTSSYLIHPRLDPSASGGYETGQTGHWERLSGVDFRVSAASFFQVNTRQAERMAATVRDGLRLGGTEVVLDAYAGVGTFAALFAPLCSRMVAVEESASAVRDARENVAQFPNVEVVEARTEDYLEGLASKPDAVILDPPRSGCDERVLDAIGRLQPPRLVYVSCEPATLARDLRRLVLAGYRVVDVTPLDMFPQTHHIECVATLVKADRPLILASTSPRRIDLIQVLSTEAQALAPSADEPAPALGEDPREYARRLAEAKATSVVDASCAPVLAADTVVVAPDGRILGKPADESDAREALRTLRGREHSVITAVAVRGPESGGRVSVESVETRVRMRTYSDAEIDAYVSSGAPLDKAGAYGIQDEAFRPAAEVTGCRLNVVGLPLCLASRQLVVAGAVPPQLGQAARLEGAPGGCRYCRSSKNA